MKTPSILFIVSSIIVLLCFGCDGLISPGMHRTFTIDQFPMKPGTQWTYAVVDSGQTTSRDTVTITVLENLRLPPRRLPTLWQIRYRNHVDTVRVLLERDTLTIDAGNWPGTRTIYFPLEDGKRWGYNYGLGGDSVVVAIRSAFVPAGYFPDAFVVQEHAFQVGPVRHFFAETWLVPGIGIVRITSNEADILGRKVEWALIRYYFPPVLWP